MVAVLLVFANHLFGWPRGGFVGVDVFFVISGFLITGNLLRTANTNGNISFKQFYWNRIRRIVPAATLVLLVTVGVSLAVFQPFRAQQIGTDAFWAFIFMSNWWFAVRDTNYFAEGDAASPIQHYWSLSIEEQFYFVWPALIFVIGLLVASRGLTHSYRMRLAGLVMAFVVVVSLGWAIYQTSTSPAWAYFDTFGRVWELGIGALLATAVGALARVPVSVKPFLSWGGLILIGASAFLIGEGAAGFPAPWAVLPVAGSALVIAAGVGVEPEHQGFLRNRASVYVGNISYSLYLVHWPVIVILGAYLATTGFDPWFAVAVIALSFGLAIASYHFVENPLRYMDPKKVLKSPRRGVSLRPSVANGTVALIVLALVTVGGTAFALRPVSPTQIPSGASVERPNETADSDLTTAVPTASAGPNTTALQQEIADALKTAEWPALNPSMEQAVDGPLAESGVYCQTLTSDPQACGWGSPDAASKIVLVGDSVGLGYAGPLRQIAVNSNGAIQFYNLTRGTCAFSDALLDRKGLSQEECVATKEAAIEFINSTKPDLVIISNRFRGDRVVGSSSSMTMSEWSASLLQIVEKFRANTKKIAFIAQPAGDMKIKECFSNRSSKPPNCIGGVDGEWSTIASTEESLASSIGAKWIDSRPWFCDSENACPSFVGTVPTKRDTVHMVPEYGLKIYPAMGESLKQAGVLEMDAAPSGQSPPK